MKTEPNCCNNLDETIEWFKRLKEDGSTKEDILDGLEFDSDQYPNYEILKQARDFVFFKEATNY